MQNIKQLKTYSQQQLISFHKDINIWIDEEEFLLRTQDCSLSFCVSLKATPPADRKKKTNPGHPAQKVGNISEKISSGSSALWW